MSQTLVSVVDKSRKKGDFCTSLTKVENFQLTHVCQKASATKILTICNSILTNQKISHQLKFQICFVISWNNCRRSKFPSLWLSGRLDCCEHVLRHVRKLEVLGLKPGYPCKAYLYLEAVCQTFQSGVLFLLKFVFYLHILVFKPREQNLDWFHVFRM